MPKTNPGHFKPGHHSQTERRGCAQLGHEKETAPNGRQRCRTCNLIRNRRYAAERLARYRREALAVYGEQCACCGEDREIFLAFDHTDGGGNKHRRDEIGGSGSARTLRWMRANGYPPIFRVLCHNCNYATTWGRCPHEQNAAVGSAI